MNDMYPELEDYIFNYCSSFWTPEEGKAWKTYNVQVNAGSSESVRNRAVEMGWISQDPAVLALLADGYPAFRSNVARRIWTEHRDELELNYCPSCRKIARTPLAKQCRFCGHDWH
ncbi:hypothetical protein [Chitinophaga caseinilytica]|uniref:hypothetical protein n=1 Tax=Chitinophaga caseinilytica TaxID=2267521 RepID=UPI003C30EAF2